VTKIRDRENVNEEFIHHFLMDKKFNEFGIMIDILFMLRVLSSYPDKNV